MGDYIFFIRLSISTVFSLSLILVVLFSTGFGLLFPGRPPFTATYLYLIVSSISSCVKSLSLVGPLSWPSCTCQCHFCLVALFHSEFNIYYCLNGMPYLFHCLHGHQIANCSKGLLPSHHQITPQHPLLPLKDFLALMQQTLVSMPM